MATYRAGTVVPVRQWVLSLPHRLRYVLAWDHALCRAVSGVFVRAVLGLLRRRARQAGVPEAMPPTDDEMDRLLGTIDRRVHRLLARRGVLDDPAVLDIDAVEDKRMDVDVQIQRGSEALNDRHCPAASAGIELVNRRNWLQAVQNGELGRGEDVGVHSSGASLRKATQSGTVRRETRSAPPPRKKARIRSGP